MKLSEELWPVKGKFIRLSLHLFNTIILFSGIILTVCGLFLKHLFEYDHMFVRQNFSTLIFYIIVMGICFLFLGFMSFISLSQCGNSMMHAVTILFLILATSGLCFFGVQTVNTYKNTGLRKEAKVEMNATLHLYIEYNNLSINTQEIDLLQSKFKCCGLDSYEDWKKTDNDSVLSIEKYKKLISPKQIPFDLPDSCCRDFEKNCGKDFRFKSTINLNGCFDPFFKFFNNYILTIVYIVNGMAAINILSVTYLITVCIILKGDYNAAIFLSSKYDKQDADEDNEERERLKSDTCNISSELDW